MTTTPLKTIRLILLLMLALLTACQYKKTNTAVVSDHRQLFVTTLKKHLDAVSNKDLPTLASTLSPTGEMQLILPQTEIIDSVDGFLDYHRQWFASPTQWSFETRILNSKVFESFGMAIVEIVYREPERNGQPYFNRMTVSYDLEYIKGQWYIIKDHASSVQKSTDNQQ